MIEQAMIFALGFLSMGLVVILFLPAIWGRAMRLSRRRLERQMPLSMAEVTAEHDRLRAEFAVARRRIEQKWERASRTRAGDLAELGRRAARIATLEQENAARRAEIADFEQANRALHQALTEASAELGALRKDHYDLSGLLERTRAALARLNEEYRALDETADQRRATIASLQTFIEGAKARIEDLEERIEDEERTIRQKAHEAQLLTNARDAALAEVAFLETQRATLETRLEAQSELAEQLQTEREAAERAREVALSDADKRSNLLRGKEEAIDELEARVTELQGKLAQSARNARAAERDLLERIEVLRAENASLQGALAARREGDGASEEKPTEDAPAGAAPVDEDESARLKRSILEIAAEVRRLSGGTDVLDALPRLAEIRARRENVGAREGGGRSGT